MIVGSGGYLRLYIVNKNQTTIMKNSNKATRLISHSFFIIAILVSFSSNASDYYVSSREGNDDNNGLSASSAWKSLLKVTLFRKFQPGDRILLKAGESFEGPLKLANDGNEFNPITVGRYGTGANPIVFGNHPEVKWSPVMGRPGLFVTNLNGGSLRQVYTKDGKYVDMSSRGTLALDRWLDTMSVNKWGYDLSLKLTYIKTEKSTVPPNVHLFEFAVVESYKNYVIIENLDVRNGYLGISAGGTGTIVRNNTVRNTIWNGIYLNKAINGEAKNNDVSIVGETPIYIMKCKATWVHHNVASKTVGTILGMPIYRGRDTTPERCGIAAQMGQKNLVEHNNLSDLFGSFFDYWYESGTITRFNYGYNAGAATTQGGTNLQFYGNICNLNGGNKGISATYEYDLKLNPLAEEGPILIFNNVVNDFVTYGLLSVKGHVIFRNNILRTNAINATFVNFDLGSSSDFNSYYSTAASSRNGWVMGIGLKGGQKEGFATLELFRTATGQDKNSIVADPKFLSVNPLSPDDFKLSKSSPCIDKGQNLKFEGFVRDIYTDYAGTAIPQNSTPDIGAFEYIGNVNAGDDPASPTTPLPLTSLKVNFQDSETKTPVGWLKDFGQAFGQRTSGSQGQSHKFGWLKQTDRSLLNIIKNGRNRGAHSDTSLVTLMHMQANGTPAGIWEAQVVNGKYDVTVSVGDYGAFFDSRHSIKVEGVQAIVNFVPTPSNRFKSATVTVTVTDGLLTIDAIGGKNTKINYIAISPGSRDLTTTTAAGSTSISSRGQQSLKTAPGEDTFQSESLSVNQVYPNPSRSNFNLIINGNGKQSASLTIFDLTGRVVETRSGIAINSVIQIGRNLNPGTYLVQVVQGTQKVKSKIIKL